MTTADLEAVAAGKRTIDSTEAPQIARELLAARDMGETILMYSTAGAKWGDVWLAYKSWKKANRAATKGE